MVEAHKWTLLAICRDF